MPPTLFYDANSTNSRFRTPWIERRAAPPHLTRIYFAWPLLARFLRATGDYARSANIVQLNVAQAMLGSRWPARHFRRDGTSRFHGRLANFLTPWPAIHCCTIRDLPWAMGDSIETDSRSVWSCVFVYLATRCVILDGKRVNWDVGVGRSW